MSTKLNAHPHAGRSAGKIHQQGAAVLATAMILLFGGTILAFVSAQLVLDQTKVTSNDFRTAQATEAALAGIDEGIAFFNNNGTKINLSSVAPTTAELANLENGLVSFSAWSTGATKVELTNAVYYFANSGANDRCNANGALNGGTLYSTGWSDDFTAKRTVSVCLGIVPLMGPDGGPKQPFVTRAGVGALGNSSIVNRYTNISVWAGDATDVSGNAFDTWLRPAGTSKSDFTKSELQDEDPNNNSEKVSDASSGFGVDIVVGDKTLANSSTDEFWATFFSGTTREDLRDSLKGRVSPTPFDSDTYDDTSDLPVEMQGQFWSEGDFAFSGSEQYGNPESPVIMIVNGNLRITGSPKIYGIVYVTGELDLAGTMTVVGSVISENGPNKGTGTMQIVYKPWGGEDEDSIAVSNSGVVIPGSWKDW